MFTKRQLNIIRAVSTLLFVNCKDEDCLSYWTRPEEDVQNGHYKGVYFYRDTPGDYIGDYCLYVKMIDESPFMAIEEISFDEYGTEDERTLLGCVQIDNDPRTNCYSTGKYCQLVEQFVGEQITLI